MRRSASLLRRGVQWRDVDKSTLERTCDGLAELVLRSIAEAAVNDYGWPPRKFGPYWGRVVDIVLAYVSAEVHRLGYLLDKARPLPGEVVAAVQGTPAETLLIRWFRIFGITSVGLETDRRLTALLRQGAE